MHPVVRALGKILRMVGISSPEDTDTPPKTAFEQPTWRTPAEKKRIDETEP